VIQCEEGEVTHVAMPQKVQQERRLVYSLWRKAQKHSGAWGIPPKGTALKEEGWRTRHEVVMFVEGGGCKYKGTKTEENRGQGFITGKQLRNLWCGRCLEAWKQRKNREGSKIECVKCGREDIIIGRSVSKDEKEKVLCPEYRTGEKKP